MSLTSHGSTMSEDSQSEDLSASHGSGSEPPVTFYQQQMSESDVDDRFATLRPAQFVARQVHEHQGTDAAHMIAVHMQSIGTNLLRRSLGIEGDKYGAKEYFSLSYWV